MLEISRSALFGKLNSLAYKAIEGATVFCKLRGNPYVELVHWIQQILQTPDSDLHRIVRHFELDPSRLAKDVTDALDRLPRGASSISDLSAHVENAVERGWVYAHADVRRTARPHRPPDRRHAEDAVAAQCAARRFRGSSSTIKPDTLTEDFAEIVNGSPEDRLGANGWHRRWRRRAKPAAPWRRRRWASRRRSSASPTDLTERARKGEIDPVERPRRGDPPDRRHPDAPPAEQPDPDRRGRRRQDRGGRRLRAAAGARRRAAAAAERVALHARHRPAAGRREHEGRVREPAAAGDRRGAGVAEADHPVHRRGAHADRRRRRGRHRRRREPAQAGAGARHAAHDRRDDLGRVQEVHREGPGADPALPGRAGRRAERGEGDPDGARRRVDAREAPSRAGARRGARGRGAAVASLHPGAAAARQGGEPARHRVRARRHQPARACRPSSRTAAATIEALRTEIEIIGREEAVGIDVGERRGAPLHRSTRRNRACRC